MSIPLICVLLGIRYLAFICIILYHMPFILTPCNSHSSKNIISPVKFIFWILFLLYSIPSQCRCFSKVSSITLVIIYATPKVESRYHDPQHLLGTTETPSPFLAPLTDGSCTENQILCSRTITVWIKSVQEGPWKPAIIRNVLWQETSG